MFIKLSVVRVCQLVKKCVREYSLAQMVSGGDVDTIVTHKAGNTASVTQNTPQTDRPIGQI